MESDFSAGLLYCRVPGAQEQLMAFTTKLNIGAVGLSFRLGLALALTGPASSLAFNFASAQALDKVSFGTNSVAEGEHGGA